MNNKQILVERHLKETQKHANKQKLQEARRKIGKKNPTKKPRIKKISINNWDEFDEFDNFSPIMPIGSRERRRLTEKLASDESSRETIITNQDHDLGKSNRENEGINQVRCIVIEAGPSLCRVEDEGEIYLCELRGKVKDTKDGYVNPVAVGDQVMITITGEGRGVVESVLPRRSVLARPYSPNQGKIIEDLYQIVVANVDRLLIVVSWREPYIWPALIDRFLVSAQRNHLDAVICINKIDLVEDWDAFREIVQVYEKLNYPVMLTSAVNMEGIEQLNSLLQKSTTVFAGLSGVGKSSLLTAIQPNLDLRTGEVSERGPFTGQGRHTTTSARLWQLDSGGIVIDTPGLKSFALVGIKPDLLGNWYPEMIPYIPDCRFNNCTHINEPGCAVRNAVSQGVISPLRYKNYTQLFEELTLN